MPRYRVDILNRRGQACFHAEITQQNDQAAALAAPTLWPGRRLEIWEGSRRVALLDTAQAPSDLPHRACRPALPTLFL
jgi:hypothetical protein